MELESVPFSVAQIVEGAADVLIAKARQKGLSLMTYIAQDIPSQSLGDPGRVGQILLNLIGNAIKFSSRGGVSIRVERARGSQASSQKVAVRFEIEDTGIGLSESVQDRIFQPFMQGEGSTARRYGGTGLGLSICKRLVESMGGTIGVSSAGGKGSTFWFEILLGEVGKAQGVPDLQESLINLEAIKTLIVDDDLVALDIVDRYAGAWKMRSTRISSLPDTLRVLKTALEQGDPYSLALIGQGTKPGEGAKLGMAIKLALGERAPKLILLTDFEMAIKTAVAKASGFEQAVSKPVKQSSLHEAILSALSGASSDRIDGIDREAQRGQNVQTDLETLPSKTKLAAPQSDFRILVADDVVVNQMLTLKLLEKLGYGAHSVANGKEVLSELERTHYDLVLMDCQMPEMDGFEATQLIRQHPDPTFKLIPIIALTANAMAGDDKKCLAAGMNDYLSKPVSKERLQAKLTLWLNAKAKKVTQAAA
jgi:CheY-like chemotaxis protein